MQKIPIKFSKDIAISIGETWPITDEEDESTYANLELIRDHDELFYRYIVDVGLSFSSGGPGGTRADAFPFLYTAISAAYHLNKCKGFSLESEDLCIDGISMATNPLGYGTGERMFEMWLFNMEKSTQMTESEVIVFLGRLISELTRSITEYGLDVHECLKKFPPNLSVIPTPPETPKW